MLFDLGETLLSFGKADAVELFRTGGRLSYDFLKSTGQNPGNFKAYVRQHLWKIRLCHIWSQLVGKDFDSLKVLKKIETRKGIHLDADQWAEFAWQWYEPLSKLAKVEVDIKQTLGQLRDRGIKLGILSNTFIGASTLDRHLEQFGLLEFFEVRLYSYMYGSSKPDKRIFQAAAEAIGQEPADILFVGDRIDKDVKGAEKTGMRAVLKSAWTNENKKTPPGVTKIEMLAELPALIDGIAN